MLAKAKSKYIKISPYKLRPVADNIRGNTLGKALAWLDIYSTKRTGPVKKVLLSAYSNIKNHLDAAEVPSMDVVVIREIRVDQGPVVNYFKPGAMGKASLQRRRMCHIEVVLDKKKSTEL